MGELFGKSLREVIEASASKSPTPGGGSVSAIIACFGLAMTAMVCNLTLGKEKYKDAESKVEEILCETNILMQRMEELVEADMSVFSNLMAAYRLPGSTAEEKAVREATVQKALRDATGVPMEIARTCLKALQLTDQLSPIGSKMAVSDAGVAALLAEAALNSALMNIEINIPMIKNQTYIKEVIAEKEKMAAEAGRVKEKILAVVRERMK